MSWTENWIGIEYMKDGRDRETGLDCYGLFLALQEFRFGRSLHDFAHTTNEELRTLIARRELSRWRMVKAAQEGDAVFFRAAGHPLHIGYALDEHRMLHIENEAGSCIDYFRGLRLDAARLGIFRHAAV